MKSDGYGVEFEMKVISRFAFAVLILSACSPVAQTLIPVSPTLIPAAITLDKESILGERVLDDAHLDLSESNVGVERIPAHYRIDGHKLDLIADDDQMSGRVLSQFKIVEETPSTLTVVPEIPE